MKPMVRTQFHQIAGLLEEVREQLRARQQMLDEAQKKREEMQQEAWRHRKRITTLNRIADDYDLVEEENRALHKERKALRAHFESILNHTKALADSLGP